MDDDGWQRVLISGNFRNVGEALRKSLAEMAKRLYQERSANYLVTFLARLIPLDKQPGVLRQVIGQIVMKLLRKDY